MPPRDFEAEPPTEAELQDARKEYRTQSRKDRSVLRLFTYASMGLLVGVSEGHALSPVDVAKSPLALGSIALFEASMELLTRRHAATASEERLVDFIPEPGETA